MQLTKKQSPPDASSTTPAVPPLAYITVQEAAAHLRVSESTIYEAIHRRQLAARRFGRRWLLSRESIESALAANDGI